MFGILIGSGLCSEYLMWSSILLRLQIFNKKLLVDGETSFYCGLTMIHNQKHFHKVPKVCAKPGRCYSCRKKGINSILRWIKGGKRLQVLINNIKELEILFLHNFCRLTRKSADIDQCLEDDSHVILAIISLRQIFQMIAYLRGDFSNRWLRRCARNSQASFLKSNSLVDKPNINTFWWFSYVLI